ncbi:hypothetical protein HPB51_003816 [Rhipicephalus microplus]|uniref:Endonuclease/exonuclease/phosphatase domain-containing protein n=1 Tax=Rhipicephalus microplus TaxID=6941 RepID=A0A9J6EL10_RHIMP|nr:hypothetical protein HPB51_003816 [Rhipicephalus microplus]
MCKEDHVTGSCPFKLRLNRSGPSPGFSSKPQAPARPTGPIIKSSRPSRPGLHPAVPGLPAITTPSLFRPCPGPRCPPPPPPLTPWPRPHRRPPKVPSAPILLVLRKALCCAGRNALAIVGDFNAPHTCWCYPQNTLKGHSIWNFIHNERLSIFNDFTHPTRIRSSVQRDTNPDLAFARNVADSSWSNTGVSLGSDHYVLCTTFPLHFLARSSTRLAQVVHWDRFRPLRLSASSLSAITDLSVWTETI